MPFLEVQNLSFRYAHQPTPALEDVTFDIKKNTINIVIGPNGSGKSTLLRSILGINDYSGQIRLNHEPISNKDYQIGYLPQRFEFDPFVPITAREVLQLAMSKCAHSAAEQKTLISEALKQVHADSFADELIRDLSGGQLQRVLLARALVHKPQLLLLDEPEAGVDPGGERVFYKLLNELVTTNKVTALIASHEISLVRKYADQVICLNKRVVCAGDPDKMLTPDNLDKLYQEDVKLVHHHH